MKNNWGNQDKNAANKRPLFIQICNPVKKLQTFQVYKQSSVAPSLLVQNKHMWKCPQWQSKRKLTAFATLQVKRFTFILLMCLYMYIPYIHAKYMSNIFFNIQIYFITPGCQHHTNVLFYIRVCASACPHRGTGRCLWVSINYQLESECKTDTRCPLLSIMLSLPLFR